jgi:hypothetical protein
MPIEMQMDDMQMEITKGMAEDTWDIEFLSEAEKDTSSAKIIATHTDSKGSEWVARSDSADLNPAAINLAKQILEWMAARN